MLADRKAERTGKLRRKSQKLPCVCVCVCVCIQCTVCALRVGFRHGSRLHGELHHDESLRAVSRCRSAIGFFSPLLCFMKCEV